MQAIGEIRNQWERPGSGTDATRTASAALSMLFKLTDRTEKDKQDDKDAIMHITEGICRTLLDSTDGAFMGPSRALPSHWRDKYRQAYFRPFCHGAQSYDEQSGAPFGCLRLPLTLCGGGTAIQCAK
jgi:hypothetical protein